MEREKGSISPESKKTGLKFKVTEIYKTFQENRELEKAAKKMKLNNENLQLIESFNKYYGDKFQTTYYSTDLHYSEKLEEGACLSVDRKFSYILYYMYKRMYDDINGERAESQKFEFNPDKNEIKKWRFYLEHNGVSFIISRYIDDFLKHVELQGHSTFFDFSKINLGKAEIKKIKDFIKREKCRNCYFDFGDRNFAQDNLKDFVDWFTKKGKSGTIDNCVIRVAGKEYHSSGDYRYESFD